MIWPDEICYLDVENNACKCEDNAFSMNTEWLCLTWLAANDQFEWEYKGQTTDLYFGVLAFV